VIIFIENVFRFSRGLRSRRCSAECSQRSAYQPTLPQREGQMQERITSTKKGFHHSVRRSTACRRTTPIGAGDDLRHLEATDPHMSRAIFRAGD